MRLFSPFRPLTLSLRRGAATPPPFRIFPHTIFAFLLRLPNGQFTHPLSRYSCIYAKNFKNFCHEKSWGLRGCNNFPPPPPLHPEREGVPAKINTFSQFSFSHFFPFVITMTMFLKDLRHKVDLVKCFTFNL